MPELNLSQGQKTLVGDEDYLHLRKFAWYILKTRERSYAIRLEKGRTIYMHRVILNAEHNEIVDHIDGNGLNNIRLNLRIVTHSENLFHRHRFATNSTGYRGVTYRYGRYQAKLNYQGTRYSLGTFDTKEEAAAAWNAKAIRLLGEHAPRSQLLSSPKELLN